MLANAQHLLCQFAIGFRRFSLRIVGVDALSLGADFGSAHGKRDVGREHLDLVGVGLADECADLLGVVRPVIDHGQQNAVDLQARIDLLLHLPHRAEQLLKTFGREILRLHRYHDAVGGGERVDGQHAETRHTVDQHIVVRAFDAIDVLFEDFLAVHGVYERHLKAEEGDVRGQQVDILFMMENAFARCERAAAG
ncbi:hypothetical protein SDC9_147250 [bioreactor metagenome]|uniref:Uncharacterized protein n=1 Tax=bioreactor metagenome TaxID=1076179 RepID=A0A645EF65_9ZZZZ